MISIRAVALIGLFVDKAVKFIDLEKSIRSFQLPVNTALGQIKKEVTLLKINVPSCQINVHPYQINDPPSQINVPTSQINKCPFVK